MQFDPKIADLKKQIENYSREELLWFNGYLSGLLAQNQIKTSSELEVLLKKNNLKPSLKPVILYASETGNSKKLAFELSKLLKQNEIQTKVFDLATYKIKDLEKESYVVFICSTQGEGEAPLSAQGFFTDLEKETLDIKDLKYSIVGLGDTSYPLFCKAAQDLDDLMKKQSAKSQTALLKLDVDYKQQANEWFLELVALFLEQSQDEKQIDDKSLVSLKENDKQSKPDHVKTFYKGKLLHKVILNDRGSNKKTYHIELATFEDIEYHPGDALGVYAKNNHSLLQSLADSLGDKKRYLELESLNVKGLSGRVLTNILEYLQIKTDQTRIDLIDLLQLYTPLVRSIDFDKIISLLNPISPRLYSIASSLYNQENQIDLTVGLVEFENQGIPKKGMCSCYLSELEIGQEFKFYIHKNQDFYLPDDNKDIIMIGPGTGIAPFRGFLQERDQRGVKARNWLFFGEQHFVSDFYYQTEIQQWLETQVLTRLDTAFSRDQKHKIYVQDRLKENAKELWKWIQSGAVIYLCGQKSGMSEDVESTLVHIIMENQNSNQVQAQEYLEQMFLNGQYKKDVY